MKSGVYKITNKDSGKFYVGSSINLLRRIRTHRYLLSLGKHVNPHLQAAWNKSNGQGFEFSIVLYCKGEDAVWYEQQVMDCLKPEYNILPNARSALGVKRSESTKALLSKASSASWLTPAHRHRRMAALISDEYIERRRKLDATPDTRLARSSATRIAMSRPETKEKHRQALKDAFKNPELRAANVERQRIAQTRPGMKEKKSAAAIAAASRPEVREKLSQSSKQVWADPGYRTAQLERLKAGRSTEAAKQKLASSMKGKWDDPEYRAKNCKFSDDEILSMLRMRMSGVPVSEITRAYDTDKGTVYKIIAGKAYTWVDRSPEKILCRGIELEPSP